MTKHVHADLMLEYAKDAQKTDKPWKLWQWYDEIEGWCGLGSDHPSWKTSLRYRRKPETIYINGQEVPKPTTEPLEYAAKYFVTEMDTGLLYCQSEWYNDAVDKRRMSRGLAHTTKEAAIAHAKALLSFTQN